MSNTFEIDKVVAATLGLMANTAVLGATVHRDAETGFSGGRGDTVRVRRIKARTATNFTGITQYTDVAEDSVEVKLTEEPTDAVKISTRQASLDVYDYGAQVLAPQVAAVTRYVEMNLAKLMNTQSDAVKDDGKGQVIDPAAKAGAAGHVLKAITAASAEFTRREIDPGDRYLAVGPDVQLLLLDCEQLQKVNEAGDSIALRKAVMGDLFGFRVVVSPHLTGAVAYHRTALALANRAPSPTEGAKSGAQKHDGFAVRVTQAFSPDTKSDVSIVDSFCGSAVLDDKRMIPMKVKA